MTPKKLILAAAAAFLTGTAVIPASASVTYTLNALSSYDIDGVSASGRYTFTVPDFIRSDTSIPVADLAACSIETNTGAGTCLSPSFLYGIDEPDSEDEVATLRVLPPGAAADGWTEFYYYFAPGSFEHAGTYDSQILGSAQQAVLTVSTASAVDEPSSFALLAAGMAVAGALRRRSRNR